MEARFTGRSGDTRGIVLKCFKVYFSRWFWGCEWQRFWGCFGKIFRRGFGDAFGSGILRSSRGALEQRGHDFWRASGCFLGLVLEHFFFKSGQKVDQKMDKIFVQNLATIFAQNLATGVGMHVKIHADRKSGISQLVPFFGQKSCPFSAPVSGQNRFREIIFRIPRGREVANL